MNASSDITIKIINNGWRQGSILQINSEINTFKRGLYLLLSQDCDICHSSFEDDPFIEIIYCQFIENSNVDGNLTHGKNPRRIQFQLSDNNHYECLIKNRGFIDRKLLAELQPHQTLNLSKKILENIIHWVTKRYDRDAFPFEFDRRLKNRKKIKKLLEKHGEKIIGIFIQLNTENELPENKPYKVNLVMLNEPEEQYSNNHRTELNNVLEKIYELMIDNEGIEVPFYSIKTIQQITLAEFLDLRQLDFDYLSFREFPDGKLI